VTGFCGIPSRRLRDLLGPIAVIEPVWNTYTRVVGGLWLACRDEKNCYFPICSSFIKYDGIFAHIFSFIKAFQGRSITFLGKLVIREANLLQKVVVRKKRKEVVDLIIPIR